MFRLYKTSAIALFALLTFAPAASAQRHAVVVQRPPVVIVESPFFWGPGWYDPYYPYGPYGPPYAYANTGEIKLVSPMKNASVYIDGGYAGVAHKLKKFSLRPGTHEIALRDDEGRTFFQEKVHVIAGRTTKINAGYPG